VEPGIAPLSPLTDDQAGALSLGSETFPKLMFQLIPWTNFTQIISFTSETSCY
jgi:hypothetical protein